ncbi:glycosyltransferase family 4 protein [Methylobacterium sp. JK268]
MIERVVVISDDAVESGGAAGIALLSVRLLAERGIPVTVLNGSAPPAGPVPPGAEVISLGGEGLLQAPRGRAALTGLFSPAALRFVGDWIRRHDTPGTVYHLHNWHKVLSPAAFWPLRAVADRLLVTAHDYFLVCPNGGQMDYPRQVPCARVPLSASCLAVQCDRRNRMHKMWRVARHAVRAGLFDLARTRATVVAVHEGMLPYLARGGVGAGSLAVLRNPVLPWCRARVPAEANAEVLFVGRLEADKGVDVVAWAARRAGVPLRIIGDGPLRGALERDHPEVRLMGWRRREEIAALARSARLVVAPTRWRETFGLVALEALTSGIPVLISRHALIAPEVEALGCAETCDPTDPEGLAGQLARLARDDAAVRAMSLAGIARARDLAPTPEAWADGLLALYGAKVRTAPAPQGAQRHIPPALPRTEPTPWST